jgi:long-chain acyl-CoA synthetase
VTATFTEASTLPELLRARAAELGSAGFVRRAGERLSYAEFDARTDATAAGLHELGVRQGDVVSVYAGNSIEYLEAWWATVKLGAVFGPVNNQFTGQEAAFVMADSGAVVAFCDAECAAKLETVRESLPALRDVVLLGDGGGGVKLGDLRRVDEDPPRPTIQPHDLAALVYTSGTTGKPKGAMLTHASYLADTTGLAELLPARRGDRLGMILPLFHVNAQVATTLTPIVVGAEIAMWESFSASSFWATVAEHQPITFSCVPTILAALLYAPGADEADTSSLEYVICGAAPLSRALFERFESKFGLRILEGYGLTEGTCVSTLNPYWGPRKVGSIGLPLRGQKVVPVNVEGATLEPGEPGELTIQGPNLMLGYYQAPAATAKTLEHGWLRTGDVGYVDEDGYLFLVDRVKDMIIRGGENIYPREVEEALASHPGVREAAVVGRPDEVRGEEVHAVVVLTDSAEVTADDLTDRCRATLARYKVPTSFDFRPDLPRTATGKVDKKVLRAELEDAAV